MRDYLIGVLRYHVNNEHKIAQFAPIAPGIVSVLAVITIARDEQWNNLSYNITIQRSRNLPCNSLNFYRNALLWLNFHNKCVKWSCQYAALTSCNVPTTQVMNTSSWVVLILGLRHIEEELQMKTSSWTKKITVPSTNVEYLFNIEYF